MDNNNYWWECTFSVKGNDYDSISEFLDSIGCVSTTFESAYEAPTNVDCELTPGQDPKWDSIVITALFDKETPLSTLRKSILTYFADVLIGEFSLNKVEEKDWQENFRQEFQPNKFGKLWVCPSWHEIQTSDDEVVVTLDPGLAFGTGSHPTTKLCLEWLANENLHDKTVIDFGCGSGILAIAALKLGAKHVWAIDHDEQALTSCLENAKMNNIDPNTLTTALPKDINLANMQSDVLVANILYTPLTELKDTFYSLLTNHGKIAMSGILEEQTQLLIEHYKNILINIEHKNCEQWCLVQGEKYLAR